MACGCMVQQLPHSPEILSSVKDIHCLKAGSHLMGCLTFWTVVVLASRGFDSLVNTFDLSLERMVTLVGFVEFVVGVAAAAVGFVKLNSKLSFFVVSFEVREFVGPQIVVQLGVAVKPLVVNEGGHLAGVIIGSGTVGEK